MLIFGRDQEIARWAGQRLGIDDFGPCVAIGVERNGVPVAAAIYNHYGPPNIEITFVTTTPRWATRDTIAAILRYPFVQLNCRRITATTLATNATARRFLERLGFRQEGFHPDAMMAGDAVSYGLLRADAARWIGG